MRQRSGYTLIELVVVIVIIGLASAIVLPALLRMQVGDRPLQSVIENARSVAAARGEIVYLRIEPGGAWHLEVAGAALGDGASGRMASVANVPLTILVSPAGSCALDVRSASVGRVLGLDPLSCKVGLPVTASSS